MTSAARQMDEAAPGAAANEARHESAAATADAAPASWIEGLARILHAAGDEREARLHTTLSCSLRGDRPMLFLPPEMGTLQPRGLAWLHALARRHGLGLVEDRRRTHLATPIERRDRQPAGLALGISMLLQQTGMPGGVRTLSSPHRLRSDNPHVELDELVRMAAAARSRSKRVVLLPNRLIVETTGQATDPIVARACRLATPRLSTVLSQFDSPSFRAVGYSSGRQYVVHVFLAGGRANAPGLWTQPHLMTRTGFRFRLFPAADRHRDFGLFHATFHYDVADGEGAPWWLAERVVDQPEEAIADRRAGHGH